MRMNLDGLRQKLIAAARSQRPSEEVPYGLTQRIMARLTERPALDPWMLWGRGLGRAAIACAAISLLAMALSYLPFDNTNSSASLDQEFASTMLAPAEQLSDSW
jgi:hypothetical protein